MEQGTASLHHLQLLLIFKFKSHAHLHWLLSVNLTLTRVTGKWEPQLRYASLRVACGHVCRGIFLILIDVEGPGPLQEVLPLGKWA